MISFAAILGRPEVSTLNTQTIQFDPLHGYNNTKKKNSSSTNNNNNDWKQPALCTSLNTRCRYRCTFMSRTLLFARNKRLYVCRRLGLHMYLSKKLYIVRCTMHHTHTLSLFPFLTHFHSFLMP